MKSALGKQSPSRKMQSAPALARLEIRDPKVNALLWVSNEPMKGANLQSNRDKNYDEALARLMTDVAGLTARAAAATAQAKP